MELKIEYVRTKDLVPYEKNTRKHEGYDVGEIAKSIQKYGFNDPIGVWKDNIIIEGHGRLLAAKKLGMKEVPIIRLDHLTDEERREYAIMHNKTAELSNWDFPMLEEEVQQLDGLNDFDIEFSGGVSEEDFENEEDDDYYTTETNMPQYEIKGEKPDISELLNKEKSESLIDEIKKSGVNEEVKDFLIEAAKRHNVFDYRKVAEFYAQSDEETQRLMENSGLVIVDYNDAIQNGFVQFSEKMKRIMEENEG